MSRIGDDEYLERAKGIQRATQEGANVTRKALLASLEEMVKLTRNTKSSEARALVLEAHAFYIGVGTEFMDSCAPELQTTVSELVKGGVSELEAEILRGIFVAKIFENIVSIINEP